MLVPRVTPAGNPIARRGRVDNAVEALTLVARGAVVHPTVASAAVYMPFPGVTHVPLRGLPPARSALVWRAGGRGGRGDPRLRPGGTRDGPPPRRVKRGFTLA
ncbi:hypothetical protein GCM10009678_00160 [Actinomadura kijaniata]